MDNQNSIPATGKNQVSDANVMESLQKEKGPAEVMSTKNIIKYDCETNGCPVRWEQIYAGLVEAVKSPKYRIMRANNSLFAYSIQSKGFATGHVITADNPTKLIDSLKQFHQAMIASGFKQVKSKLTNPQMLRAIKMAGIKVKEIMSEYVRDGSAVPAIEITMEP